jgi:hypothetical protein
MSWTDWLLLPVIAAAALWAGWHVAGITVRLRGGDPNGWLRWFDAGVGALVIVLAFVIFTLT